MTNLVAFYNGVTAPMVKRRADDVTYLDFFKVFDRIPHNIIASNLKIYGFDEWTIRWIRKCLDGYVQQVIVHD